MAKGVKPETNNRKSSVAKRPEMLSARSGRGAIVNPYKGDVWNRRLVHNDRRQSPLGDHLSHSSAVCHRIKLSDRRSPPSAHCETLARLPEPEASQGFVRRTPSSHPRQKSGGRLIFKGVRHRIGPYHRDRPGKSRPQHPRSRIRPGIAHRPRRRYNPFAKPRRKLVRPVERIGNGRMRHADSFGDILQGAASPQRRFHSCRS
jgi:hypothetical protein